MFYIYGLIDCLFRSYIAANLPRRRRGRRRTIRRRLRPIRSAGMADQRRRHRGERKEARRHRGVARVVADRTAAMLRSTQPPSLNGDYIVEAVQVFSKYGVAKF